MVLEVAEVSVSLSARISYFFVEERLVLHFIAEKNCVQSAGLNDTFTTFIAAGSREDCHVGHWDICGRSPMNFFQGKFIKGNLRKNRVLLVVVVVRGTLIYKRNGLERK